MLIHRFNAFMGSQAHEAIDLDNPHTIFCHRCLRPFRN